MDRIRWERRRGPGANIRLAGLVAIVVILALLVTAKSGVAQAVTPTHGDTVRVTYYGRQDVFRFLSLRGDTLAVRTRDGVRLQLPVAAVERTEVVAGRTPRGHQIAHDAAIGAGIGLVAGILVAALVADRPDPGDCTIFCGLQDLTEGTDAWVWTILAGAGTGAAVGAVRPRAIIWKPVGSLAGWATLRLQLQATIAPSRGGGPMVSIGLRI